MKALVGAFNQEKALVGTDGALHSTNDICPGAAPAPPRAPGQRQDEEEEEMVQHLLKSF